MVDTMTDPMRPERGDLSPTDAGPSERSDAEREGGLVEIWMRGAVDGNQALTPVMYDERHLQLVLHSLRVIGLWPPKRGQYDLHEEAPDAS